MVNIGYIDGVDLLQPIFCRSDSKIKTVKRLSAEKC